MYVWLINVQFDIWLIDDNVMTIVIVAVITYNELQIRLNQKHLAWWSKNLYAYEHDRTCHEVLPHGLMVKTYVTHDVSTDSNPVAGAPS